MKIFRLHFIVCNGSLAAKLEEVKSSEMIESRRVHSEPKSSHFPVRFRWFDTLSIFDSNASAARAMTHYRPGLVIRTRIHMGPLSTKRQTLVSRCITSSVYVGRVLATFGATAPSLSARKTSDSRFSVVYTQVPNSITSTRA